VARVARPTLQLSIDTAEDFARIEAILTAPAHVPTVSSSKRSPELAEALAAERLSDGTVARRNQSTGRSASATSRATAVTPIAGSSLSLISTQQSKRWRGAAIRSCALCHC